MSHDVLYNRNLSISSEKTLDDLENISSANMDRNLGTDPRAVSRNPNQGHTSPVPMNYYAGSSRSRDGSPVQTTTKVSWPNPTVTETLVGTEERVSYDAGHSHMTNVCTVSCESPVRRLKGKEEQPKAERELSDAYIDSISRTPRYELGRHNTYDDLLLSINSDDPFHGDYHPSGKQRVEKQKTSKSSQRDKSDENNDKFRNSEQLANSNTKKKSRHRKKRREKATDMDTSMSQSYTNTGYVQQSDSIRTDMNAVIGSVNNTNAYSSQENQRAVSQNNCHTSLIKKLTAKVSMLTYEDHLKNKQELDQKALVDFVAEKGIKQRECIKYVKDHNSRDRSTCYCGRKLSWHLEKHIPESSPPDSEFISKKDIWHHVTHSVANSADSFGVICFQGFGPEPYTTPYMRLCPSTDLETVWTLLTTHWRLPTPKLLISVTGGAQRFDLNPRLKAVFKRGLINAATTTGAWIITGGSATGVMHIVGEAVRDHLITLGSHETSVVALGIATWGCVANREALDGEDANGLFPANYYLEDISENLERDVPLDHNHTHFLLVDDGTEGKFGREIEFRTLFEKYISQKVETGVAESQSVNAPVVMLVVEGGVNTMQTVSQAIERDIPVLILNGSGRAADYIAYGYSISKNSKNEDKSTFDKDFNEDMKSKARTLFAWKKQDNIEKKIEDCLKQLKDTLTKRKLVNIFDFGEAESKDIDRAILYALLKANKTNIRAQLALALAWNRCDIARHEIFTQENRQHWKNMPLYDAMVTALVQDKVDFVQLFLENGVSLKRFLSIETLWNLYSNALQDTSDAMAQLLNNLIQYLKQTWGAYLCCKPTNSRISDPDLLCVVGKMLVHLLGNENLNPYNDTKYSSINIKNPQLKWLQGNHKGDETKDFSVQGGRSIRSRKNKKVEYDFDKTADRELFYWAILLNRKDLAKMLWKSGTDQLGAALVASSLLKALAAVADDEEELELSIELTAHADIYEDMAVGVLSECYKKDKLMAHQCLVRKIDCYGNTTLFALANSSTLMKFMGHSCCQTKLNLIWKGRMAQYTQIWKICLSLLLPFFIPAIKFTTNDSSAVNPLEVDKHEFDDLEDDEEVTEMPKEDMAKVVSSSARPSISNKNAPKDEIFVKSKSHRLKISRKKLFKVQMFSDPKTNSIGFMSAIYFFYTAPVCVFIVNTIAYLIFLGLFSFFILTDLYPNKGSNIEYLIWSWALTMIVEEGRQVLSNDNRSLRYKVRSWFDSMWNRFDLAMYLLLILSVILRFTLATHNFTFARIFYSLTVAMYFMRFMQVFFVEKNIGPKVIVLKNMLIDLMFFLGIFLVFLLGFGVMYQTNLYPNDPASWRLLKKVIYTPYWQMYGELNLDEMNAVSSGDCTSNETIWRNQEDSNRCPEKNALVIILAAVYVILINILLVNLLIAMFSYTFQAVQDKSEQVWRFYRYSLVYEFYDRPMFCPPLIIISHIYRLAKWCSRNKNATSHNEFRLNLADKDNNRLLLFIRTSTENYVNASMKASQEEIGNKVKDTANRIEKVIEELDSIKEQVKVKKLLNADDSRPGTALPMDNLDVSPRLSARKQSNLDLAVEKLKGRMDDLGEQVAETRQQSQQIMDMLGILLQQISRSSSLEIHDVTHSDI